MIRYFYDYCCILWPIREANCTLRRWGGFCGRLERKNKMATSLWLDVFTSYSADPTGELMVGQTSKTPREAATIEAIQVMTKKNGWIRSKIWFWNALTFFFLSQKTFFSVSRRPSDKNLDPSAKMNSYTSNKRQRLEDQRKVCCHLQAKVLSFLLPECESAHKSVRLVQ